MKKSFFLSLLLSAPFLVFGQWYVNPAAATNGDGSVGNPFNDFAIAVQHAADNGGGDVLVPAGIYELTRPISITTAATAATAVTIKPVPGAYVKFDFGVRSAFTFEESASHITLEGFEIDGGTDETDFWCVVAQDFWSVAGNPDGGGLAVIIDGEFITIRNNYIHDCYQKGVEIRGARYAVIEGNIIHSIANTSLSGGHGIMRQQKGREFFDDDLAGVYRWDIHGNLIFNVAQRIYSWVPSKGFIEMVIDEGKSILIDDPKDTDGQQERMSARIKNNIVAFGVVDHIRLKSTPNLEVSNNSVYSQAPFADGITDKGGDTPTPQFTNFIARNNAAQVIITDNSFPVNERRFAIELDDCIDQSAAAGTAAIVENNYALGRRKPSVAGITQDFTPGQLFTDPDNGDFSINTAGGYPGNIGVEPAVLADLSARSSQFGVPIGWDGWITDHLKLSQTILDNIPGLNDGVAGNETVFADNGVMAADYHRIQYTVVDGIWKTERNSPNQQDFELNEEYQAWYTQTITNFPNAAGGQYERIRWGDSEVKQDQVFVDTWLTHSQITAEGNTLINGYDNDFTLDGDLLVEFAGYTPSPGESFDLITAGTISSNNGADIFQRVLYDGFTPVNYSLEIVDLAPGQALRLTILDEALPVEWLSFTGEVISKTEHQLDWVTALEAGNDFFEVQRSEDGLAWEVLGTISATNSGETEQSYRFTDDAPLSGVNLYRLRQVDLDGGFSFSTIVQLSGLGALADDAVYPNPFTDRFVLPTSGEGKHFAVFSADGRNVSRQLRHHYEDGRIIVNANSLPAGTYIIHYDDKVTVAIKR